MGKPHNKRAGAIAAEILACPDALARVVTRSGLAAAPALTARRQFVVIGQPGGAAPS